MEKEIIMKAVICIFLVFTAVSYCNAADFIIDEYNGETYNFVSSYDVLIDRPPEAVWKRLENLKSWMYTFELSHYSGEEGKVGQVLQLYPNQPFYIQITGKIKDRLLTIVNLPVSFSGEQSTGVGVVSLTPQGSKTFVRLTMSRRYEWVGEGESVMKTKRLSSEFQKSTEEMWVGFLNRLKELSEKE